MSDDARGLVCPLCGQTHSVPNLRRGDRAQCVRCGALLTKRGFLGADAALAFSVTGLLLAMPASYLPWVTLSTIGDQRATSLFGAVEGLWQHDMQVLAALVFVCGTLAPVLLLGFLAFALLRVRLDTQPKLPRVLSRIAAAVQAWAMPEVQVLGVLVAFFKLGDLVDISVGPGLWLYGAVSLSLILAWRGFSFQENTVTPASSSIGTKP